MEIRKANLALKSELKPETDINSFFTGAYSHRREANLWIYNTLGKVKDMPGISEEFCEPLRFFNLLYEQWDIIVRHYARPIDVREHFRTFPVEGGELCFLLYHLVLNVAWGASGTPVKALAPEVAEGVKACLDGVHEEADALAFRYASIAVIPMGVNLAGLLKGKFISFEHTRLALKLIDSPLKQIEFLLEMTIRIKQSLIGAPDAAQAHGAVYIQQCEIEIDLIKRMYGLTADPASAPLSKKVKHRKKRTFDTLFRDSQKGAKLLALLKAKRIIDKDEVWLFEKTDVVILSSILSDSGIIYETKVTTIGKILCEKFGIGEFGKGNDPFDISNFNKRKNAPPVWNEFESIVKIL